MNCKYWVLSVFLLLSATGCSSSPQSLAENHLKLIQSGNASKVNQQYCMPNETLRLHTVRAFQILSSQSKKNGNFSYTEVVAKVETDQYHYRQVDQGGFTAPQKEVLQQVTLEIWKSDDFYQESVKAAAKFNDLAKSTAALTGNPATSLSAPERTKINQGNLCVFLPFEQFESDQ